MWRCISVLALVAFLSGCGSPWLQFENAPLVYRVKSGDTLHQVAFRYRLDPAALAQWNGIGRSARIIAGYDLQLRPPLPGQLHPVHGGLTRGQRPQTPVKEPAKNPPRTPPPKPQKPPPVVAKKPPVSQPTTHSRDKWLWPVDGKVIRRFGAGNDGIDITVAQGSPVQAVADGTVVYGGSALKGYGLLVIVQHAGEVMSAYAHSSELLVGEGQAVTAGQVIARTGLGPGQVPMLHFEVRRKGQPVNPLPWLPTPG